MKHVLAGSGPIPATAFVAEPFWLNGCMRGRSPVPSRVRIAELFCPEKCAKISCRPQDPLGFDAGDSNLYRYAFNRPTVTTDPSGCQPAEEDWENIGPAEWKKVREVTEFQWRLDKDSVKFGPPNGKLFIRGDFYLFARVREISLKLQFQRACDPDYKKSIQDRIDSLEAEKQGLETQASNARIASTGFFVTGTAYGLMALKYAKLAANPIFAPIKEFLGGLSVVYSISAATSTLLGVAFGVISSNYSKAAAGVGAEIAKLQAQLLKPPNDKYIYRYKVKEGPKSTMPDFANAGFPPFVQVATANDGFVLKTPTTPLPLIKNYDLGYEIAGWGD